MTLEQRIKLLDAGYTRAEIDIMEPLSDPASEPAPEQAPAAPQPNNPQAADANPPEVTNAAILAAIQQLVTAQQAANLNGTGRGASTDLTPENALAMGVFGNKT